MMEMKRIMVVEDEGITAMRIKSSLEEFGYDVTSTEFSGEEAFKRAAEDRPDLVLMDIVLAGEIDGIEAAGQIHSVFNIPIVYLTAHSDEEILRRIKKTSPLGYIVKPFDENELRIIVELAFYKHGMEEALRESEMKYRKLFENATDAIYLIDPETQKIFDCNPKAAKITGYTIKQLRAMTITELHPEEEQDVVSRIFKKINESGSLSGISDINQLIKSGILVPVEINAESIELKGKKYILCIIRDITLRKKAEENLRYEKNKLISILNGMEDGVYIVNQQYDIEYVNPAMKKEYRYVKSCKCYESLFCREEVCPWCKIKEVLEGKDVRWEWYCHENRKSFDCFATPLFKPDGSISKLEILHDITKLKQTEEKLQSAAVTDELTGLFNRRGFFTLFEQHRMLADRNKRKMYLTYLDLDGLKAINDVLGHKAGDQALLDAAGVLRKVFRKSDVVARIGGDEFAVLLTEPSQTDVDTVIIKHIRAKLEIYNKQVSRGYELLFSVGVTHYDPENPSSIDELLTRADKLMYEDKKSHKLKISDMAVVKNNIRPGLA
jgi:diguanylate cyclase (GGDEF)-like protein/PAS domain S-box-containing protein